MDRARLRQIIKEELNRELSEMGRPGSMYPAPTAGYGMGLDAAGFPLGGNPSYKHHGDRYSGGSGRGAVPSLGFSWMPDMSEELMGQADRQASGIIDRAGSVKGSVYTQGPGTRADGKYTVTVSDSDIEAGYLHADVEMDDGSMGDGGGDTWWDAINDAVGVAQGTGPL
jgi:hypothetical protein